MKLFLLSFCLIAGWVLCTDASPFFFNVQRTISFPQNNQNTQIRRQPVVSPGTTFGLGGIISKWFPGIIINKRIGTPRPKPSQRPVIEVTTVFVPSELDKEDQSTSSAPAEVTDSSYESSSSTSESGIDEYSSTASTIQVEKTSTTKASTTTTNTKRTTTTTTTALPFEEIEPFTESKTTTTTTPLPFEETEPSTTTTTKVPAQTSTAKWTTQAPAIVTETEYSSTSSTTYKPFIEIESSSTSTTTGRPTSTTDEVGFWTEEYVPSTEVTKPSVEYLPSGSDKEEVATIKPTTGRPTSTTDEVGFFTEEYVPSTEVTKPSVEYLPSGSDKEEVATIKPTTGRPTSTTDELGFWTEEYVPSTEEVATIKPTTYKPAYVPTTSTTTTENPPWKETPIDVINNGGNVNPNKPPESYLYVRPAISVDEILLNEVSPRARPFESISLIGTKANGATVEQTYNIPEAVNTNIKTDVEERPRITFYSNYY